MITDDPEEVTREIKVRQCYREIAREMRLEEEGTWDCRGLNGSAGLLNLREKCCSREDNLERAVEDAIGATESFLCEGLVN